MDLLKDYWIPIDEPGEVIGAQLVDGQWYAPKYGCDTLDKMLEDLGRYILDCNYSAFLRSMGGE